MSEYYKDLEELNKQIESWTNKIESTKDASFIDLQPYLNSLTFAMARRTIIINKLGCLNDQARTD